MKKRKLTVKVSSFDEALASFKEVWEKAEACEKLAEPIEIVGFENASFGIITKNACYRSQQRACISERVDIKILSQAGLLLQDKKGHYSIPWDKIITEIPMTEWVHPQRHVSKAHAVSHSHHSTHR